MHRVQHRFQIITCRAEQAAPKVGLPRQQFHLPHHSVKQRWDWTVPKTFLAEQGKSWFCPGCSIAVFFFLIHLQLASRQVVMLSNKHRCNFFKFEKVFCLLHINLSNTKTWHLVNFHTYKIQGYWSYAEFYTCKVIDSECGICGIIL